MPIHRASVFLAGIYVVEDVSETYIEKPFLDKGSFTEFVKNAIDIVQCRWGTPSIAACA
jgi:hypothetical protein